jgi:hypothetical protein
VRVLDDIDILEAALKVLEGLVGDPIHELIDAVLKRY